MKATTRMKIMVAARKTTAPRGSPPPKQKPKMRGKGKKKKKPSPLAGGGGRFKAEKIMRAMPARIKMKPKSRRLGRVWGPPSEAFTEAAEHAEQSQSSGLKQASQIFLPHSLQT